MKISELFRKKILDTYVGGVINKFKIEKRRNCLFFGDIFINYIKECESSGFSEQMEEAGRQWMFLYFSQLVPSTIKSLPFPLLSKIMKRVWVNLGLMDDFQMKKEDDIIQIKTRGEVITGQMGPNKFSVGLFTGICNVLLNSGIEVVCYEQNKEDGDYIFRVNEEKKFRVESKGRREYYRLNFKERVGGFSLNDALKNKIFRLRENMIYFRGRKLYTVECTLFHLVGDIEKCQKYISEISFNFFKSVVENESTDIRKLGLLKTILQTMGWGVIKIKVDGKNIIFYITNPPFGLQKKCDNWNFLERSILGYLWIMDKRFSIKKENINENLLQIIFTKIS